ncbi:hypothetical protein ACXET9_00220 [Brachybacterium sp. DNPG3]
MEPINLGAVLFVLLLVLWLGYALPRTASRRDVMGRARSVETAEPGSEARDLSEAVHNRRPSAREVSPAMSQDRLLLRPADPTSRPRFDAAPGLRVDPIEERARSRRLLTALLVVLIAVAVGLTVLAVLQMVHWAAPVIAVVGVGAYLVGLRRAELERRTRARRAAAIARLEVADRAEAERAARRVAEQRPAVERSREVVRRTSLEDTERRASEHLTTPGAWTPRPVPRPTYEMRGEVDDLATRHAQHRESIRSATTAYEAAGVEEAEAAAEAVADQVPAPAVDLRLDEVLARRRA